MIRAAVALVVATLTCAGVAGAADWPLFGQNAAHSGVAQDRALSPGNVTNLKVRWHIALGAVADSAPIVVGNRLYVTDRNGTTYGIDVVNGHILWRFTTQGPKITTSVPAYDEATHALYVGGVDGALHKLDPATGSEQRGNGFPASITLAPETEKDASPLNLANGYLYAQTSGYIGDATPYVGHIVAIRLSDGDKRVFNTLCSDKKELIEPQSCSAQRSGMWSRAGVVVDPDPSMHGRIYGASGNAPFDAKAGNYGDTIVSLNADATRLIGYETPDNYAQLDADDADVGSSSPALLPRLNDSATPLLAVQAGKDRVLRLFDRSRLAGLGAPLQTVKLSAGLFSAPAVWEDNGTPYVFLGLADGVRAFHVATRNRETRLEPAWQTSLSLGREGSSPVVAGGVLFIATNAGLVALNAQTGQQLWTSDALGAIHWESPAVSSGAIYCSDESGALTAFALPPRGR